MWNLLGRTAVCMSIKRFIDCTEPRQVYCWILFPGPGGGHADRAQGA